MSFDLQYEAYRASSKKRPAINSYCRKIKNSVFLFSIANALQFK